MSFSLYVHIPWCQSKCPYCDFNSHAATSWPEGEYTRALISELETRKHATFFVGEKIKTIFFGGGTPSLFDPKSISMILDEANRAYGIEHDAEITLESNPGTVNAAKLAGMRAAGINRISFGAQSFNAATLKFLGRIHSADETREAARLARRAGFDRMNLDLIFAVPGQTTADVLFDIESIAALEPDHISAYNLTFEEGTAFFTELKRGRIKQLANDDQAAMYATVREEIPRRGFPMYEISNYAPPGHEARHNLTYWRGESYLGIGAGAHSFARDGAGGRRWWNEKFPTRYISAIETGGLAEAGAEAIDEATAQSEFVFLNLRLRDGFALSDFHERFGRNFECIFGSRATPLFNDGLLMLDAGRIMLTDRGLEMADSVFAEFV
ncbi:MAG: Oxygen-independent coproporphyrinogen-III oxidase-like protein [Candidatus Binatus sp.]|nr:Oxygen-independent coproporphyrinogen-III oxidase-like protein [Candidatus Binatus sp.]